MNLQNPGDFRKYRAQNQSCRKLYAIEVNLHIMFGNYGLNTELTGIFQHSWLHHLSSISHEVFLQVNQINT